MAIDLSGLGVAVEAGFVIVEVENSHPLISLCNELPWQEMTEKVTVDLKQTTAKGFWMMGRKTKVRMHLGAYLDSA